MAKKFPIPTCEEIQKRYEKAHAFNDQIKLYETVSTNENFFIGNQ